jgi:hypothetical protein
VQDLAQLKRKPALARHIATVALITVNAAFVLVFARHSATSWHYFNDAAHALLKPKHTGP